MLDPWRPGWFRLAAVAVVVAVVLLWYALLRRRIGAAPLATGGARSGWRSSAPCSPPRRPAARTWSRGRRWSAPLTGHRRRAQRQPGGAPRRGPGRRRGRRRGARAHRRAVLPGARPADRRRGAGFVAALLVVALLPAFELLFPDEDGRRGWPSSAARARSSPSSLAVACAAVGLSVDRFDVAHPVPSQLAYALDRDTGQAWWASTESAPGAYTAQYVGRRGTLPVDLPYLAGKEMALGDGAAGGPAGARR